MCFLPRETGFVPKAEIVAVMGGIFSRRGACDSNVRMFLFRRSRLLRRADSAFVALCLCGEIPVAPQQCNHSLTLAATKGKAES
jgi:hypothetical protein